MRTKEFKIAYKDIELSDESLLVEFYETREDLVDRKAMYDKAVRNFDKNKYGDFLIAKLYYEFAIEKHNSIVHEVNKRGLNTH